MDLVPLITPVDQLASVARDATLVEAVQALEACWGQCSGDRHPHRTVLVMDPDGKVIGKLDPADVLKGLEDGYREVEDRAGTVRYYGLTRDYLLEMMQDYGLWKGPLEGLCRRAGRQLVRHLMQPVSDTQIVSPEASLGEAIHLLVTNRHECLLVVDGDSRLVGIVRLVDVFCRVTRMVRECPLD